MSLPQLMPIPYEAKLLCGLCAYPQTIPSGSRENNGPAVSVRKAVNRECVSSNPAG